MLNIKLQHYTLHHFHQKHNASCLSNNILQNNCFQFLLGITDIPREIKDNGYATFLFYFIYLFIFFFLGGGGGGGGG